NLSLADRRSLPRGRKRECGEVFAQAPANSAAAPATVSGKSRPDKPLVASKPPGRQDEATIREPGDLPSAVSTRQTSVGVYRWMIQKTKVFWSSLAPATGGKLRQVTRT